MIHGIGSNHNSSMHQMTECIHNHSSENKMGGASLPPVDLKPQEPVAQISSVTGSLGGQFSLMTWVKNTLSGGKKLLLRIWGESAETPTVESLSELQAGAMMQTPQAVMQNNPYFVPVPEEKRENLLQRMRVRFQSITKYFTNQFSGRNSFQTKQEKPKEDLRRHSRYREDDTEIDCVITDDSYLLDSYDKRGEYSKLSAKK